MTDKKLIIKLATNPKILEAIKEELGVDSQVLHKIRDNLKDAINELDEE